MDYRGHQVFIIHPDRDIRIRLVYSLRRREYETFGMGELDAEKLKNRRDSVFFLHITDDKYWSWRDFADRIALTGLPYRLVAMDSGNLPAGFDHSIPGNPDVAELTGYLDEINARGHRHFVRFGSQNASIATFDFQNGGRRYAGVIHDLSISDISCTFKPEPENLGHLNVDELNLNIPGYRATLSGRFTVNRVVAGQIIHVFHFIGEVSEMAKDHIYDFIYSSLEMKLSLH